MYVYIMHIYMYIVQQLENKRGANATTHQWDDTEEGKTISLQREWLVDWKEALLQNLPLGNSWDSLTWTIKLIKKAT